MKSYRDFTVDLAVQAGELLQQNFQPQGTPATLKADHSFVTEVDLAADQFVSRAIHQAAPDEILLSEENHSQIDTIEPAVWVVDPLDGTTNYSLGLHIWGISIARLVHGNPVLGVLYFPMLRELYVAESGKGAYWNGNLISTRPPDPQKPLSFFSCCSRTFRNYQVRIPYKTRILGSAAYSYCMVARNTALVAFEATPKVWDLAAAWLVVQEAGGMIALQTGGSPFPISPNVNYSERNFPTLAAVSQELFAKSLNQIQVRSTTSK